MSENELKAKKSLMWEINKPTRETLEVLKNCMKNAKEILEIDQPKVDKDNLITICLSFMNMNEVFKVSILEATACLEKILKIPNMTTKGQLEQLDELLKLANQLILEKISSAILNTKYGTPIVSQLKESKLEDYHRITTELQFQLDLKHPQVEKHTIQAVMRGKKFN
jgi:hypothetical protein